MKKYDDQNHIKKYVNINKVKCLKMHNLIIYSSNK